LQQLCEASKTSTPTMQATSEIEFEKLVGRDAPLDPLACSFTQTNTERRQTRRSLWFHVFVN